MSAIAYLCADPGIPVFGTKGASVHVQEIVRAFRARGDDVTVYATRRGDAVPDDLADLDVVTVGVEKGPAAVREQHVRAAAGQLADLATETRPDLVYERYSLFSGAGARVHRRTGAALVVEVNAPLIDEQREHRSLVDEAGAIATTRTTFEAAEIVSCVSPPVADWVRTTCPGAHDRVRVVGNGVNTARIRPVAVEDRPFTVGFVGTLKPWHGTDLLLHAFAAGEPDWRLAVCGDGPERERLEKLAADLGVAERTAFTGAIAPGEVPAFLAGLDVGVAPYPPSADHYFSPLKIYEYLAAGLPVVASALGTIPQIVEDGRTGLLVEPGDPAAITRVLNALAADPALRRYMAQAARAEAEAHHDWTAVLDRTLAPVVAGGIR